MRHFEDFHVGDTFHHAPHTLSAAEIVDFAREFDPQPFHVDPATPATPLNDGLIASGWHIACVLMRMMADTFLLDSASMGAPGYDTLKWRKPVNAGDTLTGRSVVTAVRASKSRPEMGVVQFRHEALFADGEIAMWMEGPIMIGRRPGATA